MKWVWNQGPLLLALTMLCWAGSVVVGRAASGLVPPVLFTLLRWALALLIVAPLAWPHLRRDRAALWTRRWVVLTLAVLGTCLYNILVYRGLHDTTAVNGLLMQSVMPLAVLLVGLLLGQWPTPRQGVAILISILGVLVIAAQGSAETLRTLQFNAGDALILLAVASYAVYSVVLRSKPTVHPMSLLAVMFSLGVIILTPLAALEWLNGQRLVPSLPAVAAIVYAGVFASFVATLCYNRGIELVGAARGGQFMHLMPVFGTMLAVTFLGEHLHDYHGVGVALIAAGLAVAGSAPHRLPHKGPLQPGHPMHAGNPDIAREAKQRVIGAE